MSRTQDHVVHSAAMSLAGLPARHEDRPSSTGLLEKHAALPLTASTELRRRSARRDFFLGWLIWISRLQKHKQIVRFTPLGRSCRLSPNRADGYWPLAPIMRFCSGLNGLRGGISIEIAAEKL
jgi:hypothetical protein